MAMTLITTNTSSGAATSDFTSGIDSTYKLYIFKFIDVNPATDNTHLTFQVNAASGSGFNETMTTTFFNAYHYEDDSAAALAYNADLDQAQGTAYQIIAVSLGSDADECSAGTLWLFNPSNTTYVKHFYSTMSGTVLTPGENNTFAAGYVNTTSAIDEISFKMSSGNMDAVIKMYGVG
jgi:hypothetical protein